MIGPGEVLIALVAIALPVLVCAYMARRFFSFREKQLEAETTLAAEKAAQYAAGTAELEKRIQVLEKIVTDGGLETAAQIEALRERPQALPSRRAAVEEFRAMNPFEMVVLIVFMVMIAGVLKSRYGHRHEGRSRRLRRDYAEEDGISAEERAETLRLREEVKMLKERIHVLERITVEKENSLAREIDDLRDR